MFLYGGNTFHFAGISSKSQVTRGLGRFKEVLSATKNIKSPYLTIYLKDEYKFNKFKAKQIINEIEITRINDIIQSTKIYFEDQNAIVREDDMDLKNTNAIL